MICWGSEKSRLSATANTFDEKAITWSGNLITCGLDGLESELVHISAGRVDAPSFANLLQAPHNQGNSRNLFQATKFSPCATQPVLRPGCSSTFVLLSLQTTQARFPELCKAVAMLI